MRDETVELISRRLLLLVMSAFSVAACVPSTGVVIDLGTGRELSDMDKAEAAAEFVGFRRIWAEPSNGTRSPRRETAAELESLFESINSAGLALTVRFSRAEGHLRVRFVEQNKALSSIGEAKLKELVERLQGTLGNEVKVLTEA